MKYLASVSYDGSKFYGFQRLPKNISVQKVIEDALTKINKTKVVVKGAGRTDRGVHAIDQKIHFDLSINIEADRLKNALNSLVGEYIYINDVINVNDDFHARFDVKMKTYEYIINMGEYNPIKNDYFYNYNHKLNIKAMKKASTYLLGAHDFEAFTSGERNNYNSIIKSIDFKKIKNELHITFKGKSFYRYMVRNLVGALIIVGNGKIKPIDMKNMLEKKDNIYNYMTVPAGGLYLKHIEY